MQIASTRDRENLQASDILVIGRACRLPGANSTADFWSLIDRGDFTVTEIGDDRWDKARYFHPRPGEAGKSYTFAAGVINDVWGFDAAAFGFSPREANQIDPQQRLALKLAWEAMEDAGIKPSAIAGSNAGVYAAASSTDYSDRCIFDPASGDAFTMTGNSLALIANRISYIFDLAGPSLTIDTACSSSLTALHQAMGALQSGEISLAIVAGVNLLLNPFAFTGFSNARMLSPEGKCRAFGANPQGYVRAEGGVCLILCRADSSLAREARAHAQIAATGINSDGRTFGVALPSEAAQTRLLAGLYERAGVDPNALAFLEAHGTGTRAGDAAEARAIGAALAKRRSKPLPIGSVKSNIGHLEPAAGLAGLLKAMLALEHGRFPKTLHCEALNPDIPFDDLNLRVAQQPVALDSGAARRFAGVSTFGFGGANAHAIIADPPARNAHAPRRGNGCAPEDSERTGARFLMMASAHCEGAIKELAAAYLRCAQDEGCVRALAASAAHAREALPQRIVIAASGKSELCDALAAAAAGVAHPALASARAAAKQAKTAFIFSGNGAQWAGMGLAAYAENPCFREEFNAVDRLFANHSGWSLQEALAAPDLDARLPRTAVAQPLLFALQAAACAALIEAGLQPEGVIGHSVGEVAAAYAAGALDREQAVEVIVKRSAQQELSHGAGAMAAVSLPDRDINALIAAHGLSDLTVAAINSPLSATVSGSHESVAALLDLARAQNAAAKRLDIGYPFHSAFMEPGRKALLASLSSLRPSPPRIAFYSTVTGGRLDGASPLDSDYWWRNIREPVLFSQAAASAAEDGFEAFLEIGPRPILGGYLSAALAQPQRKIAVLKSLDKRDPPDADPIAMAAARAIAAGASFNIGKAFGPRPPRLSPLPHYPWQERPCRAALTAEGLLGLNPEPGEKQSHPLLGRQPMNDAHVWRAHLDAQHPSFLADHQVGGAVTLPGAAFAEMALAAASQQLKTPHVEIRDMSIGAALILKTDALREMQVKLSPDSASIRIESRARLSDEDWRLHAECRASVLPPGACPPFPECAVPAQGQTISAERIYALAKARGLHYGPAFALLESVARIAPDRLHVRLLPAGRVDERCEFSISPTALDACFHGLFSLFDDDPASGPAGNDFAYIPVRFGALRLYAPHADIAQAAIHVRRASVHSIQADFVLADSAGAVCATIEDARFKAVALNARAELDALSYRFGAEKVPLPGSHCASAAPPASEAGRMLRSSFGDTHDLDEPRLLLDAAAKRIAFDALDLLRADTGRIELAALIRAGRLHAANAAYVSSLAQLLEEAGLAERHDFGLRLAEICPLPGARGIIGTVLSEHPAWGAHCVLLSRAAALTRDLSQCPVAEPVYSAATLEHCQKDSPPAARLTAALGDAAERLAAAWPAGGPLRVLELSGGDALTLKLAALASDGRMSLTCAAADDAALGRSSRIFAGSRGVSFRRLESDSADEAALNDRFDIIFSDGALNRLKQPDGWLRRLKALLAPSGLLIASEATRRAFHEVVFGLMPDWFSESGPGAPVAALRGEGEWRALLNRSGFAAVESLSSGAGILMAAAAPDKAAHPAANGVARHRAPALILSGANGAPFAGALEEALTAHGARVWRSEPGGAPISEDWRMAAARAGGKADIFDLTLIQGMPADGDPAAFIASRLAAIERVFALTEGAARLWIAAPGGARWLADAGPACPLAAAIWAGARAARNENPGFDIRMADFATELSEAECAARLALWSGAPGREAEMVLGPDCAFALRAERGMPPARAEDDENRPEAAATLTLRQAGSLDSLRWRRSARHAPGRGEVEIEIAASGLNFRDVMWALGMLPDEALESGFAGPTLGFECAGRVSRIGADVADLRPGDPVIAMAAAAFSSHATAPRNAVVRLPDGLDLCAAATMPVAFLTAHYALSHLAKIEAGEWVLIHGGAGGVGLAALQIAKARGARVIVTAGSEEKRGFLKLAGADHAFDSRSLSFVGDVRRAVPEGIDAALNSLSGEAMERSIGLLKPFGRFLELGKRDYYGDTKIGLRPFRRNIAYFGIDADELLAARPALAARLLQEIMEGVAAGKYWPLPYRKFSAEAASEAFRLMQQSGHIGKIIIAPPRPETIRQNRRAASFRASASGAHVIIGGHGGFGLETAAWLGRRGARNIVLVSRSGVSQEAQSAIRAMQAEGLNVQSVACDAADEPSLQQTLDEIRRIAPIKGIVHAAMVLDDAPLSKLDAARMTAVLRPKALAAEHLDRLTREDDLDYFILFSSISAFIGNPGQAPYAAANAYLEALSHRRRAQGLPALAVGWGAISDAGYLARNAGAGDIIRRRTGARHFSAASALDYLGELLSAPASPAAITIAPMDWSAAASALPVLSEPAFEILRRGADAGAGAPPGDGEFAVLLQNLDSGAAKALIARHIAEDVASIFRMTAADISGERPLADLGMDSLMLVELQMAAERRFGIGIPLSAASGALTINGIAERMAARLQNRTAGGGMEERLAFEHSSDETGANALAALALSDAGQSSERLLS